MSIRTYNTVARKMASTRHTLGILFGYGWSMARVWLEYAYTMARVCLGANILFPAWEQNIPTLGTKYSQPGNKTGLRLALDEITARPRRDYVSLASRLRLVVLMLLMMVMGVSGVWGQVGPNYSGTYYIASNYIANKVNKYDPDNLDNNFYLCPTEDWISFDATGETKDTWTTGDNKPFLTTHKINADVNYSKTKAKWTIEYYATESGIDYYYFKHSSGQYLVLNQQIDGVSGNNSQNRIRVHLEVLTPANLTDATTRNKALFAIVLYKGYNLISPKNASSYYLTVNKGNGDPLQGEDRDSGGSITSGSTTYGLSGTIGIYNSKDDGNAPFYFEDIITRPTISYSSGNEVTITYPTSATVYYTTDGSDPTDDTNQNRSSFTGTSQTVEFTNVAVVKAAAKIGEEYSNVATYVYVHTGSSNPYLLQSVENTNFYMLAGDARNETTTTVNTSSLPQAGMSWHFEDAGIVNGVQCYYIYNTLATGYLRREGNNFYIQSTKEDKNDYKFAVIPYYHEGILAGFNLYNIGKSQYIYKSTANNVVGNGSNGAVNLSADGSQAVARWNLILVANKSFPSPVTVSDNTSATYYTFASKDATAQLITPPTGTATYVKTSNGVSDYQKWYFKAAGDDGWATYYYILNAVTGEALYFGKDAASTTISDALEIGVLPETPTDNYKFALAHTVTEGEFYIIPKPLAQFTKTNYSGVWYVNTSSTLQTQSNRANNKIKWRIDEVENYVALPYINYNAATNTATISCTTVGATIYYTTDDSDPTDSNNPNRQSFTDPISFTDVTVVKAVASLNNQNSTIVTNVYVPAGSGSPYLFQNVERTDFYMIPGDVKSGNTEVNTSSLFRPTMSWYFSDAGSVDGVQYYYIINGTTGDYLYHTIVGSGKECAVYMKTSSEFGDATDKTSYMFTLVQGYSDDEKNYPDGFHIVPKSQITANNYCIYKGGWTGEGTIANASADVMKGSTNARRPEQKHTRWNFIAAPDNKLPVSLTYDSTNPDDANWPAFLSSSTATKYFKIENVGTAGRYMCPPTGEAAVGTATNGDNELAWYVIEAGHDDWRKYYYIVHASTGKYLKFNQTIADPPSSMTGVSSVLSLLDYDNSASDRYQFVFAKSTIDGAYYIVPKGLEDATYNSYYALYLDGTNPIKSNKNRASDSYKWKFVAADLFCNNPVFGESGGNITITCNTNGAEIHYTTNGDDPSANGVTYSVYPPATPLSASDKHLIKACAVVSDGAAPTPNTASSDVVTFIKNPDITFVEGNEVPYAGGSAVEPTVSSVTITPEGGSTITIDATEYSVAYSNNTDVGEAIATISDALPENNIIISGTSHFNITPKSLGNGYTAADGITITLTKTGENTYSVTVKNGTVTLTQKDDNNLTAPYDYTVSGTPDESGFVATVEAKKDGDVYTGNYTGGAIAVYVKANFPTLTSETDGGSAAAYQAPRNLAAPSDLKACIVTGVDYNAGTVDVQELTYIPEGVPVLLLTEGDATHNADFTATIYEVGEGGAADVSANKLCKSNGSVTANWGQYYIFTKGEFVLSMGDNKTIKEGKYYFENEKYVSGSSPARLYISRRGTTRINKIVDNLYLTDSWYTLNGQKLNKKPTLKGIYIRNGKKYIVK